MTPGREDDYHEDYREAFDEEDTVLRPAVPPQAPADPPHTEEPPDTADTVLRPAPDHSSWAPPAAAGDDGPAPAAPEHTMAPSDDFIAVGPTPTPASAEPARPSADDDPDFIASAPPPPSETPPPPSDAGSAPSPPWGTYLNSSLAPVETPGPPAETPEPSDEPAAQPIQPAAQPLEITEPPADLAPIQRFDQRPRFDLPAAPESAMSPTSAGSAAAAAPGGPGAMPPGVDATAPRSRRLLIPAIALGCALLLLLGIGSGAGLLFLTRPDAPSASDPAGTGQEEDPADPAQWRPLEDGEQVEGSTEELLQVLAQNPLASATLSVPAGCSLPASEGKVPDDELQAYLQAGMDCLATTWGQALQEQGVEFTAPEVVVHSADEPPADSSCAPESFTGAAPRACIADNTLYWPAEWDPGFSTTSAVESPQLYMWHLSYAYAVFPIAATSLHSYYGALLGGLEGDAAASEEMRRRYALQQSCFGSAAAFQQPTGPRPTDRVEEFVTSTEAQADPGGPAEPSAASRAAWVNAGKNAHGRLSQCNTWEAPADEVS